MKREEMKWKKGTTKVEKREKNERLLNFIASNTRNAWQNKKRRKRSEGTRVKKKNYSQTHIQTLTQIEKTTVTVFLFTIQHSPYEPSRHTNSPFFEGAS